MLASAHAPVSVRLGRPSQAVSRHQATASRDKSAGIDFTAERERGEVGAGHYGRPQPQTLPVTTHCEAAQEEREDRWEVISEGLSVSPGDGLPPPPSSQVQ